MPPCMNMDVNRCVTPGTDTGCSSVGTNPANATDFGKPTLICHAKNTARFTRINNTVTTGKRLVGFSSEMGSMIA